jgi:hypothetical protein
MADYIARAFDHGAKITDTERLISSGEGQDTEGFTVRYTVSRVFWIILDQLDKPNLQPLFKTEEEAALAFCAEFNLYD